MNFLDMGIGEILLILVVVVLIWGPGKIPEAVRNIGKIMNTLRKSGAEVTKAIKRELEAEEKEIKAPKKTAGEKPAGTENDSGGSGDTSGTDTGPDKQDKNI